MHRTTHTTYQLRGYCSRSGYARLDGVMQECATLYNAGLQHWRDAHRLGGVNVSLYDQYKEFTLVRRDDPDGWGSLDLEVGRGVLRRLDIARLGFYRRVREGETPGYPRFKPPSRWRTIEIGNSTPAMVRLDPNNQLRVRVKGLPEIRCQVRRTLPPTADLKTLNINRKGRRLYVNLTYQVDAQPLPPSEEAVGIHLGVRERLALSNGERVGRREVDRERLEDLQRRRSRCRQGSRRYRKLTLALSNAHDRERVRNRNECHRITTALVRRYGTVAVPDLEVPYMTEAAQGRALEPDLNVVVRTRLNRAILEQTWGLIRQQLAYKAERAGRQLALVDPAYTSQTCSGCGVREADGNDGLVYQCHHCGMRLDAAHNAARNILGKAMAGGTSPPST